MNSCKKNNCNKYQQEVNPYDYESIAMAMAGCSNSGSTNVGQNFGGNSSVAGNQGFNNISQQQVRNGGFNNSDQVSLAGDSRVYNNSQDINGQDYVVENRNYYNNYYTRYNNYYVNNIDINKDFVKDVNVYHYSSETVYEGCEYLGSSTVVQNDNGSSGCRNNQGRSSQCGRNQGCNCNR